MFFTKTVDSIVADIHAKIESLHALAEAHHVESEIHQIAAAEKVKLANWFARERDRARAIAEKLTSLVS